MCVSILVTDVCQTLYVNSKVNVLKMSKDYSPTLVEKQLLGIKCRLEMLTSAVANLTKNVNSISTKTSIQIINTSGIPSTNNVYSANATNNLIAKSLDTAKAYTDSSIKPVEIISSSGTPTDNNVYSANAVDSLISSNATSIISSSGTPTDNNVYSANAVKQLIADAIAGIGR